MERTVIVKFPDGFKFPEYFGQKNLTGSEWTFAKYHESSCWACPFNVGDEDAYCLITGDQDGEREDKRHKCPFLDSSSIPTIET